MEELSIRRSAIGSASGSVDLFGGFAKAAGSLAMRSLSEPKTTVLLTEITDDTVRLSSTHRGRMSADIRPLKALIRSRASLSELKDWLESIEAPLWSYHILGCVFLFCSENNWIPEEGLSFAIASDLPPRQGMCGGIALKVACIRALEKLSACYSRQEQFEQIALQVDRHLLGLPFDPSASTVCIHNKPGQLLPISGRRGSAHAAVELPRGVTLFSWTRAASEPRDPSVYHARSISAAMGKRIAHAKADWPQDGPPPQPSLLRAREPLDIPATLLGSEFVEHYGRMETTYGFIETGREYQPKSAYNFAVEENRRCEFAVHLLQSMGPKNKRRAVEHVGELLWESHFEVQATGVDCPNAASMVQALIEAGPGNGIYGGRLNPLGCHCTVLVLAEKKATSYLRRLAHDHGPESAALYPII